MAVDPKWIIKLQGGKEYPQWPGILDLATRTGLKSLTTTIVQVPSAENGGMAVVMARAEFDDGRVFEDVGDCSPASCKPQLAAAALRMASTRAKGRALRDACNIGETMYEELPGDDEPVKPQAQRRADPPRSATTPQPTAPAASETPLEVIICGVSGCGTILNAKEVEGCKKRFPGRWFCTHHATEERVRMAQDQSSQ